MFTKRLLAVITAAFMLFAACTPKSTEQESAGGLIGTAEADIFNETGFPIVREPITLNLNPYKKTSRSNIHQL